MFAQQLLSLLWMTALLQQAAVPPAPPRAAAASSTFRISGKVIDAITGQPLARATVSINPSNTPNNPNLPDAGRFETTDAEGVFVFADVPPAKYVLSARHRRYISQMYQQHEGFTTAIFVGAGFESENLIFGLRPGASISGLITDEVGDPVRHANVMLCRQTLFGGRRRTVQVRNANTIDEGSYHFGNLDPGTYFVAVSAQPWYAQHGIRHPLVFYSNATDIQTATPIALHSGDSAVADFHMRPVPAMHALVRTPAPDPEKSVGMWVTQTVADNSTIQVPAQVSQIAPGLMEVTGVPQGRYNLVMNSQHGNTVTRRTQSVQLENDAEVDATRNASSLVVSGVLEIEDGSPVPQPVSATGAFSFKDNPVETGKYELMIIEPQGLFIRSLASANAKTSGRSLEIATAQDVTVTINASKGNGRITGVALEKDKPAGGIMIVLAPLDLKSNPALFRRDQSDSDGTFTLNAVVPGRYTLMAIEDGWDLEWADPAVLQKYISGGESVQIAPNQKTDVSVKVQ